MSTVWLAIALAVATHPLGAQEVWHVTSVAGQVEHGLRVLRLGDVNGDGWDDLLEQGGGTHGLGGFFADEIWVISGADGTLLSFYAPSAGQMPPGVWARALNDGSLVVVGDMDGDGIPDYAVSGNDYLATGLPRDATLEVRSGQDHHLIWSATIPNTGQNLYGLSIAGNMDLDGDGLLDIVTNAESLTPGGAVIVYDHWGTERYRILNTNPTIFLGHDLSSLGGDLDGDGCDDFLAAGLDSQARGAVVVVSGRTGAYLRISYGAQPGDLLQEAIGSGDLDGDGVPDYAGGRTNGSNIGGAVTTFSGATGLPIHTYHPAFPTIIGNPFGYHLTSGFDMDQDGVNDLATVSPVAWIEVLSGRDGTTMFMRGSNYMGPNPVGAREPAMLAPPPGEHYPMLAYHRVRSIIPWVGDLVLERTRPLGVSTYGQADVSGVTALPIMGLRDIAGPTVRVTLSGAPPGVIAGLAVGYSNTTLSGAPLPLPLDPLGFPGITLLTSTEDSWIGVTGTNGMDAGFVSIDVPATLASIGYPVFGQWLWLDPSDWTRNGSTAGHAVNIR